MLVRRAVKRCKGGLESIAIRVLGRRRQSPESWKLGLSRGSAHHSSPAAMLTCSKLSYEAPTAVQIDAC